MSASMIGGSRRARTVRAESTGDMAMYVIIGL